MIAAGGQAHRHGVEALQDFERGATLSSNLSRIFNYLKSLILKMFKGHQIPEARFPLLFQFLINAPH